MQPRLRRTSRQAVRERVIGFWLREECALFSAGENPSLTLANGDCTVSRNRPRRMAAAGVKQDQHESSGVQGGEPISGHSQPLPAHQAAAQTLRRSW
jgi:hypothetical protein